jgi:hypothetical protein
MSSRLMDTVRKESRAVPRRLARGIDDARAFDRLPVLADDLETETTDVEMLGHVRLFQGRADRREFPPAECIHDNSTPRKTNATG